LVEESLGIGIGFDEDDVYGFVVVEVESERIKNGFDIVDDETRIE
jgi:hypothetical protein